MGGWCRRGCITEGEGCDKVGGGRVQKHRWRHLAFLKRKDDISSTNSGSREVRTAQCKVIKRSDYLKTFHKCPSSVFPCNALLPSSPHLAHYMEIVSSCVFLSPTMQSATRFLNTRRFGSI